MKKESQVIEFLNQEANQELQETFQIWQKENSEFLNFCKIIMEERRKMIGENIFGPQQSDDQSTILLIHVTTAYESLKEKLNKNQELEKQIFQLHSLQNKINQRFKEIFKNANIELLTDELPRIKAPEETPEAYQKYVEAFYNPLKENTKIESEPAKKEETKSFIFPEDILIIPETTLTNPDLPAEQIIFDEPKKPDSSTQSNAFEKDVKPLESIENKVVAETIKNRRKNYDTYLKKLYEIMDDFELARREIQDASNGKLKITDYLQNT